MDSLVIIMPIVAAVLLIILIVFVIYKAPEWKAQNASYQKTIENLWEFLKGVGFNISVKYSFTYGAQDHLIFAIDEDKKTVLFIKVFHKVSNHGTGDKSGSGLKRTSMDYHDFSPMIMEQPFDNFLGCEIKEDEATTDGIGRAIIGGFVAGEAGAVVGAITAKKIVKKYQLVFYMKDIKNPRVVFDLPNNLTIVGNNNLNSIAAKQFTDCVFASMKTIINYTEKTKEPIVMPAMTSERFDQLNKLKESGYITEEEFEKKRAEILNSL